MLYVIVKALFGADVRSCESSDRAVSNENFDRTEKRLGHCLRYLREFLRVFEA